MSLENINSLYATVCRLVSLVPTLGFVEVVQDADVVLGVWYEQTTCAGLESMFI